MRPCGVQLLIVAGLLAVTPAQAGPKDEMLAADRAFSAMSVAAGAHAAFLAYMTDDARVFTGNAPPIVGKAALAAYYAAQEKADPNYRNQRLEWTPEEAESADDGSLGFTRGAWKLSSVAEKGQVKTLSGYYVTEWRRQSDGTYKFCLDIGGVRKN